MPSNKPKTPRQGFYPAEREALYLAMGRADRKGRRALAKQLRKLSRKGRGAS